MLNNVVIVGRLTDDIKLSSFGDDENRQVSTVTVAVPRNYKNADGVYETDFIRCVLFDAIAVNTSEYCHTGDVVGIKGRLQSSDYFGEDEKKHFVLEVIAEKVTFLSSKPRTEDEAKATKKSNTKKKKAE